MKWIRKCFVISVSRPQAARDVPGARVSAERRRRQQGCRTRLVGAMIGLARAAEGVECPGDRVDRTVIEGLFTTLTNVSFDDDAIRAQIEKTHREKERLLAALVKKSAGPREKAVGESGAAASVQDTDDYNLGRCGTWTLISAP